MRRLPRGISLCLAAPEAVAGRGVVVDGEGFAFVEAGGLYVGNASGQQLVLMLQFHHFHRGLHILSFHCFALHLLYDYFFTVYDVQALRGGLALQTAAVEGVPGGVVLGVLGVRRQRDDSRGFVVAEVDVERGEAAGQEGAVAAYLEVGTLCADAGTGGGIVEGVAAAHEQDALVLGVEGRALVGAEEADALFARYAVVIAAFGRVDSHAAEDGADDVAGPVGIGAVVCHVGVGLSPLDDIRCAGLKRRHGVAEGERERRAADAGAGERTGGGSGEGRTADGHVEGQADGIPCAVLVERAATERHVGEVAVGIVDRCAVVAVIGQTDGDEGHVVFTIVEDAVLVSLHHAVVMHRVAEASRDGAVGDGLPALLRAVGLGVVAAVD